MIYIYTVLNNILCGEGKKKNWYYTIFKNSLYWEYIRKLLRVTLTCVINYVENIYYLMFQMAFDQTFQKYKLKLIIYSDIYKYFAVEVQRYDI